LKHGMVILSQRNLIPGTEVRLEFAAASTSGRVLAQLGLWDGQQLYAVEYTGSSPLFKRDSTTKAESTDERLLLQCSICSGQEAFELNDIQLTVFRSTRSVLIGCKRCAGDSLWTAPTTLDDPNLMIGSQAYEHQHGTASPSRNRTIENRLYKRVAVKRVKACLRRTVGGEDVVEVLDISRGGIRFLSYVDYPPDTILQVAVPYMDEAENMFTAGKIVRVQCRPTVDIPGEFGLEFVKA